MYTYQVRRKPLQVKSTHGQQGQNASILPVYHFVPPQNDLRLVNRFSRCGDFGLRGFGENLVEKRA